MGVGVLWGGDGVCVCLLLFCLFVVVLLLLFFGGREGVVPPLQLGESGEILCNCFPAPTARVWF